MPPTVILIRHAQALHNVKDKLSSRHCTRFVIDFVLQNYSIPDPPLTELGLRQCRDLQDHMQKHLDISHKVELIVSSPLRRTLQTTQGGLQWLIERGVPVHARGEWQENSDAPCDRGRNVDILRKEFPSFNFDNVGNEWPTKTGRFAFTREAVEKRAINCRQWLRSRPEKVIAVVSHGAFLRIGISHRWYANADYRVFGFAADGSDELVEWELTEEKGGAMGRSPKGAAYAEDIDFNVSWDGKESDEAKSVGEIVDEVPG